MPYFCSGPIVDICIKLTAFGFVELSVEDCAYFLFCLFFLHPSGHHAAAFEGGKSVGLAVVASRLAPLVVLKLGERQYRFGVDGGIQQLQELS